MRNSLLAAVAVAATAPLAAQQNPFKAQKGGIKAAEIDYTMGGDMSGTALLAVDGERSVRRQTSKMKMMGKSISIDTWTLTTPDSTYTADVAKKTGTVGPNLLPYMAKAYDDLDGDGKKRLHENIKDMAGMLAQGFGLAGINSGERLGTKSYAGQECEERKLGGFTVCTMNRAPIMLHMQGSMVCINWEETATSVKLGSASADAFTPPAGITFTADAHLQNADSMAHGFVNYMASQALADSLAKMHAAMAQAQSQPGGNAAHPPTPEQQASMQQACDMIKNFDISKAIADATGNFMKSMGDEAKRAAEDAAKTAAKNKVKGLFKRPRIP